MIPIIFSSQARDDLFAIWEYVAADSLEAADRLIDRIESDIARLAAMPGMGHQRSDVRDPRLLFWSVHSFVIAYRHTRRTLYVLRVIHGARDFRQLFRPTP